MQNVSQLFKKTAAAAKFVALSGVALMLATGCSQVNRVGANVGLNFAQNYIVPPVLTMTDADMACMSSNSMLPVIEATNEMGAQAYRLGVLMYSGAALCAEKKATEADLRYLRAAKANNITEAQDARIEQKRWSAIAAKRQYAGYKMFAERWEMRYKVSVGEGECPRMKTDKEKTIYLLGLVAGLQAVQNDVAAEMSVGIPKDIPAKVERGMKCLDNEKFWGAPQAMRAAVWSLIPGTNPGKQDPFVVIKEQLPLAEKKGIRLAHAVYAMAAQASGDDAKVRDAIRSFGNSTKNMDNINEQYRIFDTMGGVIVQNIADKYWTENTGVRAPFGEGGLTQFWDEETTAGDDLGLDDL